MEARELLQEYEEKMPPMDRYLVRNELAAMGYAPAQFEIAYFDGSRSEDDAALMKKASDQGFSDAQAVMADWYFDGSGVLADRPEANRLYALAAAQGNRHAQFGSIRVRPESETLQASLLLAKNLCRRRAT